MTLLCMGVFNQYPSLFPQRHQLKWGVGERHLDVHKRKSLNFLNLAIEGVDTMTQNKELELPCNNLTPNQEMWIQEPLPQRHSTAATADKARCHTEEGGFSEWQQRPRCHLLAEVGKGQMFTAYLPHKQCGMFYASSRVMTLRDWMIKCQSASQSIFVFCLKKPLSFCMTAFLTAT